MSATTPVSAPTDPGGNGRPARVTHCVYCGALTVNDGCCGTHRDLPRVDLGFKLVREAVR